MTDAERGQKSSETVVGALWHGLDEGDRQIVGYFVCLPPPVSIDTLSSLSGASAVAVLNLMEKLRRKGVVFEKKRIEGALFYPRQRTCRFCPLTGP